MKKLVYKKPKIEKITIAPIMLLCSDNEEKY